MHVTPQHQRQCAVRVPRPPRLATSISGGVRMRVLATASAKPCYSRPQKRAERTTEVDTCRHTQRRALSSRFCLRSGQDGLAPKSNSAPCCRSPVRLRFSAIRKRKTLEMYVDEINAKDAV